MTDALDQGRRYTYDELGNRTSQTDANGHVTRFEYDTLGRETKRILPAVAAAGGGPTTAAFETKTYDAAGNLETRTDFMGRTTTYAYEADTGRLLSRSYPNPEENVTFTYTATGRRRTAVDARGTTTYGYDLRDRLASLTYPDGRSLGYDYDPQGNRTKLTATHRRHEPRHELRPTTTLGRLATVTDPAGRVYTHGYDANGNRAEPRPPERRRDGLRLRHPEPPDEPQPPRTRPRPATSRATPSRSARPATAPGSSRAAGLPQQRTLDYSYDGLYRLTGETVTESPRPRLRKTFGYDPVGNRLSQTTTLGPAGSPGPNLQPGTIGYGYDERDRLLSEQLAAQPGHGLRLGRERQPDHEGRRGHVHLGPREPSDAGRRRRTARSSSTPTTPTATASARR